MDKVYGRQTDFIFDSDGKAYPGINLMRPLRPIARDGRMRQFQLLQQVKGQLEILAVPGTNHDEARDGQNIKDAMLMEFQGRMEITIRWVDEIRPEPSGKMRYAKSVVPFSAIYDHDDTDAASSGVIART